LIPYLHFLKFNSREDLDFLTIYHKSYSRLDISHHWVIQRWISALSVFSIRFYLENINEVNLFVTLIL